MILEVQPHDLVETERLRAELELMRSKVDNLEIALTSSRQIGAAIGILMTRRQITSDEAFDVLRTRSQLENVKIRDLAERVLYTGSLD